MNTISDLNQEAMNAAEKADTARHKGDTETAHQLYLQALELERAAAEQTVFDDEPTRSILYRSAATIAIDCGLAREAERLAALGLSGNPPPEIADELREVLFPLLQKTLAR